MGSLSIWHWLIVIVVVMLLFGRGKISDLMSDVAGGIKAFKKGMAEDDTAKSTEPVKSIDQKTATAAPKAEEHHAEGVRS
jgi:sec-independent protein translocase protein TatA